MDIEENTEEVCYNLTPRVVLRQNTREKYMKEEENNSCSKDHCHDKNDILDDIHSGSDDHGNGSDRENENDHESRNNRENRNFLDNRNLLREEKCFEIPLHRESRRSNNSFVFSSFYFVASKEELFFWNSLLRTFLNSKELIYFFEKFFLLYSIILIFVYLYSVRTWKTKENSAEAARV